MKKQWKLSDSDVNTTQTTKIKKVSIENINVSNMSLQSVINESSTKQQWNINVSEIKSMRPLKVINAFN